MDQQEHVFTGDPALIKHANYRASFSQVQLSVTELYVYDRFFSCCKMPSLNGSLAGWLEEPLAQIRHLRPLQYQRGGTALSLSGL